MDKQEDDKKDTFYSVYDMLGDMTQEEFDRLIDEYTKNDKVNFPNEVEDANKDNVSSSL